MKRSLAAIAFLGLTGCGHYADFSLPVSGDVWPPQFAENRVWPRLTETFGPTMKRENSSDVLNPSVVKMGNEFWNFYSEYDGHAWHTGLAQSTDGVQWRKLGRILSPKPGGYIAANGSATFRDGKWLYWYAMGSETRPEIGLAEGTEPEKLKENGHPVLSVGPRGSFDEFGVSDPYVIRIGPYWYMYYLGQDRARRQQLGLARSKDGVTWEKLRSNPVLAMGALGGMDDRGLGEPAVWQSKGWYWMLFTGRDAHENRSLGLARSRDGVHWERGPSVFHGQFAWDSKVICDPTVLVEGDRIRVWFGGGDIASPDQNLHGQIGLGEMN